MECDFLIVGQGIAGSILYHCLSKAGASCIVIDEKKSNSASRVAAGLINPVTGRRFVKSWMIDELIPAFTRIYREIEIQYGIKCLYETALNWQMPSGDLVTAFDKRLVEGTDYLAEANTEEMRQYFNVPYKSGDINPCFIVDVSNLLETIRNRIKQSGKLIEEKFEHQELIVSNGGVEYKEIKAHKIIFCEGSSAHSNRWFLQLPYSLNKGEALIVEIKNLPRDNIYKCWETLVPLPGKKDLWWYGSNYVWNFPDDQPTIEFERAANMELRAWIKLPLRLVDHKAAIRYATVERRPFIGFHPAHSSIGIFNGWGTKGCSLVPYFAEQFANAIINGTPIDPEVDVRRFSKVLLKA
jgi:glycine/D-amino acid oxidase-like deaminating enzyme